MRSLTIQYRETDRAFLQRLLLEGSLYGWFEHEGYADQAPYGCHRFVIADHGSAFSPDLGSVRFHRASTTKSDDSFQQFDERAAVGTQRVVLGSWDCVRFDTRAVEADAAAESDGFGNDSAIPALSQHEVPGACRYVDRSHGQRLALQLGRALHVERQLIDGAGTLRLLAPGSIVTIAHHPRLDQSRLIASSVRHAARNNLPVDFSKALQNLL